MTEPSYQVVFEGDLADGVLPDRAKANIAKLFKTDLEQIEALFSGHRVVVKRGLDAPTARKYRDALVRAGALVDVVEEGTRAAPSPSAVPAGSRDPTPPRPDGSDESPEAEEDAPSRLTLAEAGRAPPPLAGRGVPAAPADMTMAEVGATLLEELPRPSAPEIDTSHLTLSEPGSDLSG